MEKYRYQIMNKGRMNWRLQQPKKEENSNIHEKEEKKPIKNEKKIFSSVDDVNFDNFFPGLTFQTSCENNRCLGFKRVVLIPKGFGYFNIGK